jgi:hypothetical protein
MNKAPALHNFKNILKTISKNRSINPQAKSFQTFPKLSANIRGILGAINTKKISNSFIFSVSVKRHAHNKKLHGVAV